MWFFFESPVPASVARKMGCCIIAEAMARGDRELARTVLRVHLDKTIAKDPESSIVL